MLESWSRLGRIPLFMPSLRNGWKSQCHLACGKDGIHVDANCIFNPPRIPTRQGGRDGNTPAPRFLEYFSVSSFQAVLGQRQSAELILAKRIRAPDIKNNFWLKLIQRRLHCRYQRAEI